MKPLTIGLALSGGGARAIAFHLGCLRALHDRGVLAKVSVLSGVSGGSVIAAMYAYSDETFEEFEQRVDRALARGMVWGIAREIFLSSEALKIAFTIVTAGIAAILGRLIQAIALPFGWLGLIRPRARSVLDRLSSPLPRIASRTTAFERYLARAHFGQIGLGDVKKGGLKVVINAAELRTETAFRFGSSLSACWRFGQLVEQPSVATAVAASAAFPAFLPAIDRTLVFTKKQVESHHRVLITDGGVYDNLGISCMLPGKDPEFSPNTFPVDFIIACDAGQGLPAGTRRPYFVGARMLATILTIHRRTQTMSFDLLHRMAASGEITGFLLPYLGMSDARLPAAPSDLVSRDETSQYPTNFNPMLERDRRNLSKRGEQITIALLDAYAPFL
jgi:NTE family protein